MKKKKKMKCQGRIPRSLGIKATELDKNAKSMLRDFFAAERYHTTSHVSKGEGLDILSGFDVGIASRAGHLCRLEGSQVRGKSKE